MWPTTPANKIKNLIPVNKVIMVKTVKPV